MHIFLLSFIFLLSTALAQFVQPPSQDPFYQPDADFASKPAGTILRSRPIIASNFGAVPVLVQALQLLYSTRAINGSAIAAVTTVLIPFGANRNRFISYHVAEDSACVDCAPSYSLQLGSQGAGQGLMADILMMQIYLAKGYIVSVPDHEGPDAAFTAGRLEGYIALDGMRAVKNYLGNNPAIVGTGYSGGSIPTGWAAQLHSSYAADLNIKGWTMGGTPANLTATMQYLGHTSNAGLQLPALGGLLKPSAYKAALAPLFETILTQTGRAAVAYASQHCNGDDVSYFKGKDISSSEFQTLGARLVNQPAFAQVLAQQNMGVDAHWTPDVPVLLSHAQDDEIVPYGPAAKLNGAWCNNGAKVQFNSYTSGGHAMTGVVSNIAAVQFADSLFSNSGPTACSTKTIDNSAVDLSALGSTLQPLLTALQNAAATFGK